MPAGPGQLSGILLASHLTLQSAIELNLSQECVRLPPAIAVPAITFEGDANGAPHPEPSAYAGKYQHRLIEGGTGHNLPQEAPQAFAQAVVDVDGY